MADGAVVAVKLIEQPTHRYATERRVLEVAAKGDAPQVVKDVATYGGYLVAVVSAAALILRPRAAPPADGLLSEKASRGGSV